MSKIKQGADKAERIFPKNQREDVLALAMYLLGTSVFVGSTALVILLCNNCTRATTVKEFFNGSVSFWGALLSAMAVLFLWVIVLLVFRYHIGRMLSDPTSVLVRTVGTLADQLENQEGGLVPKMGTNLGRCDQNLGQLTGVRTALEEHTVRLEKAAQDLGGSPDAGTEGLVAKMSAAVETLNTGLKFFRDLAVTENVAQKHMIAFSDKPQDALVKLVDELVQDEADIHHLYIVATMRGVFGPGTYDLKTYIVDYIKRRVGNAKNNSTFNQIKVLAPSNPFDPEHHGTAMEVLRLYPVCARHFAVGVLLEVGKLFEGKSETVINRHLPLTIGLSFGGADIFPAWHLWCKRRLVILPSLGYTDWDKLSVALPIAIMARDDDPTDLDTTFTRLETHFLEMFASGRGNGMEEWVLERNLAITVRHLAKNVTRTDDGDDVTLTKKFAKWQDIVTNGLTTLTREEATALRDTLRVTAELPGNEI